MVISGKSLYCLLKLNKETDGLNIIVNIILSCGDIFIYAVEGSLEEVDFVFCCHGYSLVLLVFGIYHLYIYLVFLIFDDER